MSDGVTKIEVQMMVTLTIEAAEDGITLIPADQPGAWIANKSDGEQELIKLEEISSSVLMGYVDGARRIWWELTDAKLTEVRPA